MSQSCLFFSHTLLRVHACIRMCMHVFLTPHVCLTPFAYLHGNIVAPVWHTVCFALMPFQDPHLGLNVWMHQYMYACASDYPCMLHCPCTVTYKTWVPLVTLCVSQSSHFWFHTLVRMCTCVSTCMYEQLIPHVCSIPFEQIHGKHGCPIGTLCVCWSFLFWSTNLVRMCRCINTYMHVSLTPKVCLTHLHSYIACVALCLSV